MKVAVISNGQDLYSPIDTRFGRCVYKLVMLGERSTLINLKRMKGGDLYVG